MTETIADLIRSIKNGVLTSEALEAAWLEYFETMYKRASLHENTSKFLFLHHLLNENSKIWEEDNTGYLSSFASMKVFSIFSASAPVVVATNVVNTNKNLSYFDQFYLNKLGQQLTVAITKDADLTSADEKIIFDEARQTYSSINEVLFDFAESIKGENNFINVPMMFKENISFLSFCKTHFSFIAKDIPANNLLKTIEDHIDKNNIIHDQDHVQADTQIQAQRKQARIEKRILLLRQAVDKKNSELTKTLLTRLKNAGANLSEILGAAQAEGPSHDTSQKNTLLHLAAIYEDEETIKVLKEFGADPTLKNSAGFTASEWKISLLRKAVDDKNSDEVRNILTQLQAAKVNLAEVLAAAQPEGPENSILQKNTLSHLAAKNDDDKTMAVLNEFGANPALQNHEGRTAVELQIYLAVNNKNAVRVDALLLSMTLEKQQAVLTKNFGGGNTLLHYAAASGDEGVIIRLLNAGANKNRKNDLYGGQTPYDCLPSEVYIESLRPNASSANSTSFFNSSLSDYSGPASTGYSSSHSTNEPSTMSRYAQKFRLGLTALSQCFGGCFKKKMTLRQMCGMMLIFAGIVTAVLACAGTVPTAGGSLAFGLKVSSELVIAGWAFLTVVELGVGAKLLFSRSAVEMEKLDGSTISSPNNSTIPIFQS